PAAHDSRLLLGVIAGPYERPRLDVLEAQFLLSHAFPFRKLVGRDPPRHRRVMLRRTQILAQRKDIDRRFAQVFHRLANLISTFTHAEDDARLGEHARIHTLRGSKQRDARSVSAY